ncbi:MAG: polysaccharide deacetylase family protein [Acidobacteriaceae bacterium]
MSASSNRLFFLYHELRSTPSSYSYVIERRQFEDHADLFLSLRALAGDTRLWPEITFDDGHISNYELALPTLTTRSMTATFFLTVGWIGSRTGYMDWSQISALHAAGQRIGAHGWSHTLLTHCDDAALEKELKTARLTLEDRLGTSITSMSLPGGRFNQRVLSACRSAGYQHVFTSIPHAEPADLSFLVGRLNLRSSVSLQDLEQLLDPDSGALRRLERQDRWKSTLKRALGDRLYARLWAALNRQEPEPEPEQVPTFRTDLNPPGKIDVNQDGTGAR